MLFKFNSIKPINVLYETDVKEEKHSLHERYDQPALWKDIRATKTKFSPRFYNSTLIGLTIDTKRN